MSVHSVTHTKYVVQCVNNHKEWVWGTHLVERKYGDIAFFIIFLDGAEKFRVQVRDVVYILQLPPLSEKDDEKVVPEVKA